jgi:hypothetical protein
VLPEDLAGPVVVQVGLQGLDEGSTGYTSQSTIGGGSTIVLVTFAATSPGRRAPEPAVGLHSCADLGHSLV